jgi:hypothetical protein
VAALGEQVVAELQPLAHEIAVGLIRQELSAFAASLNGATNGAAATTEPSRTAEVSTKRCSACAVEKPTSEFAAGRAECRRCRADYEKRRAREQRARQAAEDDEPAGLPG